MPTEGLSCLFYVVTTLTEVLLFIRKNVLPTAYTPFVLNIGWVNTFQQLAAWVLFSIFKSESRRLRACRVPLDPEFGVQRVTIQIFLQYRFIISNNWYVCVRVVRCVVCGVNILTSLPFKFLTFPFP
jgi:hypothetical protein